MQITSTALAPLPRRASSAAPTSPEGPRDGFTPQTAETPGLMPRMRFQSPVDARLDVVDGEDDGRYGRLEGTIGGRDARLEMTREPHYVKVGGIMFETDPTYRIDGDFAGAKVGLQVLPDPQVSDIGGLKVQTGTIYHVSGEIDGKPVRLDVTEESHVADVGGLKVETATTVHLQGDGVSIDVNREREIQDVGNGIRVESRAWWTARGTTANGAVDLELDGLRGQEPLTAKGTAANADLALVAALRPFITAS